MSEGFRIRGLPWLNNAGNTINAALNDFVEGLVNPPGQPGGNRGGFPANNQRRPTQQNRGPQHDGVQVTPPASSRAIRQLPTIRVSPEDLVDPSNRECCICLEENCLDDKVTRLPCAHIFHEDCIIDWLTNHHCTCPVCRYELPTDNPLYEAGRLERMKARKPRYAMYELKRMSVAELLALNKQPAPGIIEKEDLIDMLVRKERIQIVPAPEPVEYSLDALKRMKVRELKRAMEDAGVFFHAKDVVEKSDMLTIFLNSGRLSLLSSEFVPPNCNVVGELKRENLKVETVEEDSDDDNDNDKKADDTLPQPQEMFPADGISTFASRDPVESCTDRSPSPGNNKDFCQPANNMGPKVASLENLEQGVASLGNTSRRDVISETFNDDKKASSGTIESTSSVPSQGIASRSDAISRNDSEHLKASPVPVESLASTRSESDPSLRANGLEETVVPCPAGNIGTEQSESTYSPSELKYNGDDRSQFKEYTISQLQDLARINNIDVSSCFERSDIISLLVNARVTIKNPSEIFREDLSHFTPSELRVLASEVGIDLSQCNDKEEILQYIVHEAMTERPHLQNYLRSLSPLAKLSLNELRRTAREWGININDCLEKGEIMQRLISRGQRF